MRKASLLLTAALLSGCVVGPNYKAPGLPAPAAYAEPVAKPPAGAAVDPARWWGAFGDAELDKLVARALADGPDIRLAASRVREARYAEIIAGAANKPTVSALGGYNRLSFSKNVNFGQAFGGGGESAGASASSGGSGATGAGGGGTVDIFSIGFDASWELDLFGGARRGREAARAQTEAAIWDRRDAAVTLVAEVADDYFMLRSDQAQQAIINDELVRQRRALEIAGEQATVGLTPQVNVVRQRTSVTSAEARLEPLRADAQARMHAIAILLGVMPGELIAELSAPLADGSIVPTVPVGLPSDLLRRRPDVRAAERNLAAATAQIGVATAQLYPQLTLTGVGQLASSALRTLFEGDAVQSIAIANATFPVIDWGRRRATVGERREDREQQYVTYQQTVLRAFRDVEDSLSQIDTERRRNETLRRAVNDAAESARAVEGQYRAGLTAQDSLLNAQANVLNAREQVAQSDAQLREQTVALFKALGGGWETLPDVSGADKRPTQPLR